MKKTTYHVIGLMSGTSLDGLDIAYCRFIKKNEAWEFSILKTKSVNYNLILKEKLKNSITLYGSELIHFHNNYGIWLGKEVKKFMETHQIEVDFVASHGHTVFHRPEIGLTYQIGSGQHIANITNTKVICDFRTNDVALGGQGAPLVPIGDQLLFGNYDFCLNLGGISNISYQHKNQRIAFDISPVNMLLNYFCKDTDLGYDDGGKLARKGTINTELLEKLNALSYYKKAHPKSLGYEWFSDQILPLIKDHDDTKQNLLRTSVAHIAMQIAQTILQAEPKKSSVLVSGGGTKNTFLIECLQEKLGDQVQVIIPTEEIIEYKEALIFAFMGILRARGENNALQSVTGAQKDSSSGAIFEP